MRKRLYLMLPEVAHCKQLITELQYQVGLARHDIHVVARDDIPLGDLPRATLLEKTELAYGLELGVIVGGIAGLLSGILTVLFPPAGLTLGIATMAVVIFITTSTGIGFSILVSALVAKDIPNHELDGFQAKITQGEILLILDVATKQVNQFIQLIRNTHPEAQIGVVKPHILQTSTQVYSE
jgi:hypothetical protein